MPWAPSVEVAFASSPTDILTMLTWTDVTQFVHGVRDAIQVTRGRQDEFSEIQPGTLSLLLNNHDGRFTPDNASGAYYPNVKLNKPIRVRVVKWTLNLITNTSFESSIADWTAGGSVSPALSQSSAFAQDGTKSLLITWGTGGTLPQAGTMVYGLTVGAQYTASAYLRVPTGDPDVLLAIGGTSNFSSVLTTKDAFVRVTLTFTATATSHSLQVWPNTSPTSGDLCYVDAVQFEAGGSATTFDATAAVVYSRFHGYVNQWPVGIEGRGSVVRITASDRLKRLAKRKALRSFLTQEGLFNNPLAYYELGEVSATTTTAGDVAGRGSGSLSLLQSGTGGTIDDSGVGPSTDGLSAPKFTEGSDPNHYAGKLLTGTVASGLDASTGFTVEFWMSTTTTGEINPMVALHNGSQIVTIVCWTSDKPTIWQSFLNGPGITGITFTGSPILTGGTVHLVTVEVRNGGATVQVWIDGTSVGTNSTYSLPAAGWRTLLIGDVVNSEINKYQVYRGTIAHVAVYDGLKGSSSSTRYTAGTTGFTGERSDLRSQRLLKYANVTVASDFLANTGLSNVASAGQQEGGRTPLEMLNEVAFTEAGSFLVTQNGYLFAQSRSFRFNPTSQFTVGAESCENIEHTFDDQTVINKVTYSRSGGATIVRLNQTSINDNDEFADERTLLTTTDNETTDRADWTVSTVGVPKLRTPFLEFEASTLSIHASVLAGLEINNMFTLNQLPSSQLGLSSITLMIEGYSESIGMGQHRFKVNTSPTGPTDILILDNATYGKLDFNKLGF